MASTVAYPGLHRTPRRGIGAGLALTIALHAVAVGGFFWAHRRPITESIEGPRDFVVAELVKLGKPREKFWLPRIVQAARPKAPPSVLKVADDPNAAPAPAEAPRPEDAELSKDVKKALNRARLMAAAGSEEPAEGLPTGVEDGTAATATAGDEYATAIAAAIRKNWTVPSELVGDADLARLEAHVRIQIGDDGTLSDGRLAKGSGNGYFDDSCVAAVKATGKVPPPPAAVVKLAARGFSIVFAGKDVGR